MDVDTILSKIEIQETTVRYFQAIDANDVDAYLATWLAEGGLFLNDRTVKGHLSLRRYFAELHHQKDLPKHLVTNFHIIVQPTGQAIQRCYLTLCRNKPVAGITGLLLCDDQLIRVEEGWKFFKRNIRFC